ncbi:YopX family protein [Phocoenobacter skyensis]|uniref:Phage uncharacterized protein TIGR01671 n=1 Tax=Phocoenobacter skyensis TaxID=97481 RepID=A0A1H7V9M1_9PAST|nr:YopX family protein [Pasteurella skyensis]QLB23359.1 hypothetical protein A6B44_09140 [Pasteurella skyensis]SEM05963.1 phage uncharacterized protein TIGR01671 [Pasteurella skyensis]
MLDITKTRCWSKVDKQYIPISSIDFSPQKVDFIINKESIWRTSDEVLLEFSTGVEDCNGKEIYKGDIIRYRDKIYYVVFIDCEFRLTTGKGYDTNNAVSLNEDVAYESKIIGNINENPEIFR